MKSRKGRLAIWSGYRQRAGSANEQAPGRFLLVAVYALLVPLAGQAQAPQRLTGSNAENKATPRPLTIGWRTDGTGLYPKAQPPLEWSGRKTWSGVRHAGLRRQPSGTAGRSRFHLLGAGHAALPEPQGWQNPLAEIVQLHRVRDGSREREKAQGGTGGNGRAEQEAVGGPEGDGHAATAPSSRTRRRGRRSKRSSSPSASRSTRFKKEKLKLTLAGASHPPGTHPTAGYSAPTPVTDGKEVFVAYGNGLVACYDLDGNRKWLKLIEHTNLAFAHSGSPVLVGDRAA